MAMRCSQASTGTSWRQVRHARNALTKASCVQSSAAAASPSIDTSVRKTRGYAAWYSRSKASFVRSGGWEATPRAPGSPGLVPTDDRTGEGTRSEPRVRRPGADALYGRFEHRLEGAVAERQRAGRPPLDHPPGLQD